MTIRVDQRALQGFVEQFQNRVSTYETATDLGPLYFTHALEATGAGGRFRRRVEDRVEQDRELINALIKALALAAESLSEADNSFAADASYTRPVSGPF